MDGFGAGTAGGGGYGPGGDSGNGWGGGQMKKAEQHKDIMDTIKQIELMEQRWREAEASRHMERALELEKRKLRRESELPRAGPGINTSSSTLRASHLPPRPPVVDNRPISIAAFPVHQHSTPIGLGMQSSAAVPSAVVRPVSTVPPPIDQGAVNMDELKLENEALRRQLHQLTQDNLQLKKDAAGAAEEIARLMNKVDELSRILGKSTPRARRPTTVLLTPRSVLEDGSGTPRLQPQPPPRDARRALGQDQKQAPISVIDHPSDEYRIKTRRRISIVPKRLIHHGSVITRKWKPPSLLEDEIDSLDDNWKLVFGNEVSLAKLEELERVSTKLQTRLRDENLMFAGLERLLKSYEKIEDEAGVEKTKQELLERRVKIDLKTRIFEEMIEKKQEMLTALDNMDATAATEDTQSAEGATGEDDFIEAEIEEWVEYEEWFEAEQSGEQEAIAVVAPTPSAATKVPPLQFATHSSGSASAVPSAQPSQSAPSVTSPGQLRRQLDVAKSPVGPRPSSPSPVGTHTPTPASTSQPRSPAMGRDRPMSIASSPSLPTRQRPITTFSASPPIKAAPAPSASSASPSSSYASSAAVASSPSVSFSSSPSRPSNLIKPPSLATRSNSQAGRTPPASPLPPTPTAVSPFAGGTATGTPSPTRPTTSARPSSSFVPSTQSPTKPGLPLKQQAIKRTGTSPHITSLASASSSSSAAASSSISSAGSRTTGASPISGQAAASVASSPQPAGSAAPSGIAKPLPTPGDRKPTPTAKQGAVYGSAVVLYDFVPEAQGELALKRGERITLRERIDDNWWEGEVRGQVGIFPHSYIQVQAFPSSST